MGIVPYQELGAALGESMLRTRRDREVRLHIKGGFTIETGPNGGVTIVLDDTTNLAVTHETARERTAARVTEYIMYVRSTGITVGKRAKVQLRDTVKTR